jgi:MoxR-like ATPase
MASSKTLRAGMQVVVKSGPFGGMKATVVDPAVMPDGHINQRKMLVDIESVGNEWIIPKLLDIPGAFPPPVVSHMHMPIVPVSSQVVTSAHMITSLDDPALDSFRPNRPKIIKEYVSRTLTGNIKDIDVLTHYWERRKDGYPINVGLVGDTQSGKTMLVDVMAHIIAKKMGLTKPLPVFTLAGSSAITDHDLFGQYRPDASGQLRWMEGVVALAARIGGILYLDEVNAMPGNVTAALHPLLDDRRSFVNIRKPVLQDNGEWFPEVVKCSTDLWVLCTYNPGYAGMSRTNEAFANRFVWLPWGYDEEVEKKLIKSPAVRLLGQALRAARETRAITTPVGTSALQRLEEDIIGLGVDFALWAFSGQFTNRTESTIVEEIIRDRSIRQMIEAENVVPDTNTEEAPAAADATTITTKNGWETF